MRHRLSSLFHHLGNVPRVLWAYWAMLGVLLYGFAVLAEDVLEQERIGLDRAVLAAVERARDGSLGGVARALDLVGGAYVLVPLVLVATLVLWRRRHRDAVFFGLATLGAFGLVVLAKVVFERTRPDLFAALVPADGYSFPSGHTVASTAVALASFFVVRRNTSRRAFLPWLVLALGAVFALAVGLSRVYLQVHYPSDVVAAWALSAGWVLGVNAWYGR